MVVIFDIAHHGNDLFFFNNFVFRKDLLKIWKKCFFVSLKPLEGILLSASVNLTQCIPYLHQNTLCSDSKIIIKSFIPSLLLQLVNNEKVYDPFRTGLAAYTLQETGFTIFVESRQQSSI